RNYYSEKTADFLSDCECRVYYTEDYWDDKPVTGKAWCKEEVLSVDRNFGDSWFRFLKIILSAEEEKKEDGKKEEKDEEIIIGDKDRSLSTSQVEEIDRNLKAIERFLVNKEYEIAGKMFEKLAEKYSRGNIAYVNPGAYKWIMKKMKESK
ncbi:MAG: hypothetical protein V1752_08865, partial [Candidatus Firestonebacteria bacterium]